MDVRGYPTGAIDAKGAFTSEIDLLPIIKPGPLNTFAEADRPHIVDQPGMRHKYLPLRHDPATGALSSGGRYLFRGYEDATKFRDFLETKVFPNEQTTFWKRPFFVNTVRFAWCVIGAHDLAPITTHDLNRFERYSVPDAKFEARLPELFPAFLEAARRLDLRSRLADVPTGAQLGRRAHCRRPGGSASTQLFRDSKALHRRAGLARLGVRGASDRTRCMEDL